MKEYRIIIRAEDGTNLFRKLAGLLAELEETDISIEDFEHSGLILTNNGEISIEPVD